MTPLREYAARAALDLTKAIDAKILEVVTRYAPEYAELPVDQRGGRVKLMLLPDKNLAIFIDGTLRFKLKPTKTVVNEQRVTFSADYWEDTQP